MRLVHAGGTIGRVLHITDVDRALDVSAREPAIS